jgi:hypothetical protein
MGGLYTACVAIEKAKADRVFQLRDGLRGGRLREIELVCGFGDTTQPDDGLEKPQVAELHPMRYAFGAIQMPAPMKKSYVDIANLNFSF